MVSGIGESQGGIASSSISSSFTPLSGDALTSHFSPYHFLTFVALETPITIIPRFSMNAVPTLSRSAKRRYFGPFSALYPVEVPLYLALYFRLTGTCTITLPSYLRRRFLRTVLQQEQQDQRNFQPLPFYFFEVAKKLLDVADQIRNGWGGEERQGIGSIRQQDGLEDDDEDDDEENGDRGRGDVWSSEYLTEVRRLVQDIHLTRQQKMYKSMVIFEPRDSPLFIPGIKLVNLVANEIEFLRHSFAVVLQQAAHLDRQRRAPIEVRKLIGNASRSSGESSEYSFSTTPVRRSNANPPLQSPDSEVSALPWNGTSSTTQLHTGYSSYIPSTSSASSLYRERVSSGGRPEDPSEMYSSSQGSIGESLMTTLSTSPGARTAHSTMPTFVHTPSSHFGATNEEHNSEAHPGSPLAPQNAHAAGPPSGVPSSSHVSSSPVMPPRKRRILRQK